MFKFIGVVAILGSAAFLRVATADEFPTTCATKITDPVAVDAWIASEAAPVEYSTSGYWYNGYGNQVAFSVYEDSTVCVFPHWSELP